MSYGCEASLAPPILVYPQCFDASGSVEPGGLQITSRELRGTLIRIAKLSSYLLFKCLLYCKFLKNSSEWRNLCALGLFLFIAMVGIEHMARPRIQIKGDV